MKGEKEMEPERKELVLEDETLLGLPTFRLAAEGGRKDVVKVAAMATNTTSLSILLGLILGPRERERKSNWLQVKSIF